MPHRHRPLLLPTFGFLAMLCLLLFPETVSDAALDAMTLAACRLIPLLFPYSVLASLMLRRRWLPTRGPLTALYCLPGDCEGVLLSGIAAGFPVGAQGSLRLYRSGRITREEAGILAAASSVPSPAFLAGAVGIMWGDVRFGWFLWIAANLTMALFSRLCRLRIPARRTSSPRTAASPASSFSRDFSRSVTEAASSCLSVTGFIVFFRILAAVGSRIFPPAGPVLTLFLEFSSGVRYGAAAGGIPGAVMTGAAAGFGGISVLMQIAAQNDDGSPGDGFSLRPYLLSRLLLCTVLGVCAGVWAVIFSPTAASPVLAEHPVSPSVILSVPGLLLLLARRDSRQEFTGST